MRLWWRWLKSDLTLALSIAALVLVVAGDIGHASGSSNVHVPGFSHGGEDWTQTVPLEVYGYVSEDGKQFIRVADVPVSATGYPWPDTARVPFYLLATGTALEFAHDLVDDFELYVIHTGPLKGRIDVANRSFDRSTVLAHFDAAQLQAFDAAPFETPVPALEIRAPSLAPTQGCDEVRPPCTGVVWMVWIAPIDRETFDEIFYSYPENERRDNLLDMTAQAYRNAPGKLRVALMADESFAEHRVILAMEIGLAVLVVVLVALRLRTRSAQDPSAAVGAEGVLRAVGRIEDYLRRLQVAYVLVGALIFVSGGLLLVLLGDLRRGVAYAPSMPYDGWNVVVDFLMLGTATVAVLLWGRAVYRVHRDLKEWRAAAASMPLR